ncbi:MAG: hypothetical protein K6G56_02935 [Clostridiales bacterium]|nr:hypothetical protein [Clostridiales bacterium]
MLAEKRGFALARLTALGQGGMVGPGRPLLAFQASAGCLKSLIATARNRARSNPHFFYLRKTNATWMGGICFGGEAGI